MQIKFIYLFKCLIKSKQLFVYVPSYLTKKNKDSKTHSSNSINKNTKSISNNNHQP